jgi:Flp pilus assembly protein TadD
MCELQMAQRGGGAVIRSAQSYFAKALHHEPDNIHALTGQGVAAAMLGDRGKAERSLRRALQIDGEHVPALFNLARLLQLTGRNAQARSLLQSVLRLQPDHGAARQMLGLR